MCDLLYYFQIYKINCLYDLRDSKVLGSNMFIFIQRNNIVKNHQLMPAFIFSYSLNVRWQKKKTNKQKATGKISVKQNS